MRPNSGRGTASSFPVRSVAMCLVAAVSLMSARLSAEYRFTTVEFPEAEHTVVWGVNQRGIAVGEYGLIQFDTDDPLASDGNRGFVYDGASFQTLDVPGSRATAAHGINDDGDIVGSFITSDGRRLGFVYDGLEYRELVNFPAGVAVQPHDINNSGQIVGQLSGTNLGQSFLTGFFTDGEQPQIVHFPTSAGTIASGINNHGQIAGTFITSLNQSAGFLLPGYIPFAHPLGVSTSGWNLTDEGRVVATRLALVGEVGDDLVSVEGFIMDAFTGAITDVELPGECMYHATQNQDDRCWRAATDMNDASELVGYFSDGDDRLLGFVGVDTNRPPDGDFDHDGMATADDIDWLTRVVRAASHDVRFDLNADAVVNADDRTDWVEQVKRTYIGDSNLDGEFSSGDLVTVFQAGQYEDDIPGNSGWASGDWNGDGDFNSTDFILSFEIGAYELGPRAATAVPEPASSWPLFVALIVATSRIRPTVAEVARLWRQRRGSQTRASSATRGTEPNSGEFGYQGHGAKLGRVRLPRARSQTRASSATAVSLPVGVVAE